MKIGIIFGTRPEIIKLYSIIKFCMENNVDNTIIHTNQHYDPKMDKIFFDQLELKQPDYNLNIGSGTHGDMTGRMLIAIEEILLKEKIDLVFVQGDTNTVLAGSLVASKLGIKVAHIEAGLRSYDKTMPEEINRIVTDHISDYLFSPTIKQASILKKEGIGNDKIFIVGNTIVDAVYDVQSKIDTKSDILNSLGLTKNKYILLTCHRPSNTDNEENFNSILTTVQELCQRDNLICIFPAHPRLKSKFNIISNFDKIKVIDPVGFFDSLKLQMNSFMIFTDSGGIQEESCILGKKCLILRTNTERPETIEAGGACLCKNITKPEIILAFNQLKAVNNIMKNPFGNGDSAKLIFEIINKNFHL
jgi:UDP-N-acetylglucosamine 2-epimerase (non-hydrolysing)